MSELPPIAPRLLRWARRHGRHDLPWQQDATPYRVWISEIMLQQTRVATVIPYFERFLQRFPDADCLAAAPLDDILAHWSGLGYYARARNLHRAAQVICDHHGGEFPLDMETLQALPGIGRSTAGAILALVRDQRQPILDGNAKRVLARYHAVPGWPGDARISSRLWQLAEQETPRRQVAAYTQAIMDLGATVCTRGIPRCEACPLAQDCRALAGGRPQDYPGPRPKRALPQRKAVFAVVTNAAGELLLQQRPPSGIWGGLWCLPEWPDRRSCRNWLRQRFGSGLIMTRLVPLQHGFTHFRLEMEPVAVRINAGAAPPVNDGPERWLAPGDGLSLGLPAPIRRLLENFQKQQEENPDVTHGALRKTG